MLYRFATALLASVLLITPLSAEEFRLTKLIVKKTLTAGVPYDVSFKYSGVPDGVQEVCLSWSGEGPFCWRNLSIDRNAKLIRTRARTGNPAKYTLSGFVRHKTGETNVVSAPIDVKAAY